MKALNAHAIGYVFCLIVVNYVLMTASTSTPTTVTTGTVTNETTTTTTSPQNNATNETATQTTTPSTSSGNDTTNASVMTSSLENNTTDETTSQTTTPSTSSGNDTTNASVMTSSLENNTMDETTSQTTTPATSSTNNSDPGSSSEAMSSSTSTSVETSSSTTTITDQSPPTSTRSNEAKVIQRLQGDISDLEDAQGVYVMVVIILSLLLVAGISAVVVYLVVKRFRKPKTFFEDIGWDQENPTIGASGRRRQFDNDDIPLHPSHGSHWNSVVIDESNSNNGGSIERGGNNISTFRKTTIFDGLKSISQEIRDQPSSEQTE